MLSTRPALSFSGGKILLVDHRRDVRDICLSIEYQPGRTVRRTVALLTPPKDPLARTSLFLSVDV